MSGIDITRFLVETATKISTTVNADGDIDYGSTSSVACLYRDISSFTHQSNRDNVMIDGLLWFGPTESAKKGDIYYHPSEGYLRITKIIKAKRLVADNTTQFIKCEVIKQRQIS